MATIEPPFYPIVYVRGYAGNDGEIEDTVAEPYMGFNLGSTKFRQFWDGRVQRHYFESPLVRLSKDYQYSDVYSGGEEMPLDCEVSPRSVFIYRYYDEQYFDALMSRGDARIQEVSGAARKIEDFAEGLSRLICRIRDRVCKEDAAAAAGFKVYLVAHSMGGLVCRCFLQNHKVGSDEARRCVDKVFTYATPHNGIEFSIVGNVPGFFTINDVDNFNRQRMAEYLSLDPKSEPSNLENRFDVDRFFSLVGTNWQDYAAAAGWSRRLTGPMSDGLVRIINATVHSRLGDGVAKQGPRSFVNRSHSGPYGIVNSEEGYQNLVRFLFGDVRVDGVFEIDAITLPREVQKELDAGKQIRASYHFETVVRVRGYNWELHRRTVMDECAVFRTFDEMFPKDGSSPRPPHLFSAFLSSRAKVKGRRPSLGFAIDVGVLVPDYEIDGRWWKDQHYKGSHLLRETIIIEATPQDVDDEPPFRIRYGLNSKTPNQATKSATLERSDEGFEFRIPLESNTTPGLSGSLLLKARPWK